jgi:NADPH2:quinone reductase
VSDPFHEIGQKAMAVKGRAIFISAVDRLVTLGLLAFDKGRHTHVGIVSSSSRGPDSFVRRARFHA